MELQILSDIRELGCVIVKATYLYFIYAFSQCTISIDT